MGALTHTYTLTHTYSCTHTALYRVMCVEGCFGGVVGGFEMCMGAVGGCGCVGVMGCVGVCVGAVGVSGCLWSYGGG